MSEYTAHDLYEYDGDAIDALPRAELADVDPMWSDVAGVLDDWLFRSHGVYSGSHGVGLFLDLLAAGGTGCTASTPPNSRA